MTGRFEGKSMVVTGAASGIGKTIARMAAEQGATVFVADVNEAGGQATVDEIRSAGGKAEFQKLDLTDSARLFALVAMARRSRRASALWIFW